ncbi:hypothetical protein DFH09DRAFT_1270492 [Mycena vulgaris]|nr:hypothetical protein DFH09DRAFT_1270492 [Mycena vulgaris]
MPTRPVTLVKLNPLRVQRLDGKADFLILLNAALWNDEVEEERNLGQTSRHASPAIKTGDVRVIKAKHKPSSKPAYRPQDRFNWGAVEKKDHIVSQKQDPRATGSQIAGAAALTRKIGTFDTDSTRYWVISYTSTHGPTRRPSECAEMVNLPPHSELRKIAEGNKSWFIRDSNGQLWPPKSVIRTFVTQQELAFQRQAQPRGKFRSMPAPETFSDQYTRGTHGSPEDMSDEYREQSISSGYRSPTRLEVATKSMSHPYPHPHLNGQFSPGVTTTATVEDTSPYRRMDKWMHWNTPHKSTSGLHDLGQSCRRQEFPHLRRYREQPPIRTWDGSWSQPSIPQADRSVCNPVGTIPLGTRVVDPFGDHSWSGENYHTTRSQPPLASTSFADYHPYDASQWNASSLHLQPPFGYEGVTMLAEPGGGLHEFSNMWGTEVPVSLTTSGDHQLNDVDRRNESHSYPQPFGLAGGAVLVEADKISNMRVYNSYAPSEVGSFTPGEYGEGLAGSGASLLGGRLDVLPLGSNIWYKPERGN